MERFLIFDSACATCNRLAETMQQAGGGRLDTVGMEDDLARTLLAQAYPDGWDHAPYLVTADYLFGESTSLCILPLNARFARLAMVSVPLYCRVPPHPPPAAEPASSIQSRKTHLRRVL